MQQQDEEPVKKKIYDLGLIKRLSGYFKKYWIELFFSIFFLVVSSLLLLAGPYLTKIAIDDYIVAGNASGLNKIVFIYIGTLVATFIVNSVRIYLMHLTGQKVIHDIRTDLFAHLQKQSLSFFDKNPVGRLVTRIVDDVEVLNDMFTSGIIIVFGDIFYLCGISAAMLMMDFKLTLVAFVIIPLLLIVTRVYRSRVRHTYRRIRDSAARINTFLQENIAGMNTVHLFCKEASSYKKFNAINFTNMDELLKNIFYNALFYPGIEILRALAIGLIVWYGGGKIVQNSLQIGVLVAFIQYINRFFVPIRDMAEKFDIFQSAMSSTEKIFGLMDTDSEIVTKLPEIPINHIEGKIDFKDVWFYYQNEEYVLKGISFDLMPGESLAIIGATGSGKTSIINILSRLYDFQKGHVLFDGKDIRHIDKYEVRRNVGIIQQDVFLFSGTIAQNICLGNSEISSEKIEEAAKYVHADSFIKSLPDGYDYKVFEKGRGLSMGQRQLIAFARAVAFNPKILILDEATSNIDTETEHLITDALKKLIIGRTSIIIAHRLSTIKDVDKVLVLKDGEVIEFGTQKNLMEQRGVFYDLLKKS